MAVRLSGIHLVVVALLSLAELSVSLPVGYCFFSIGSHHMHLLLLQYAIMLSGVSVFRIHPPSNNPFPSDPPLRFDHAAHCSKQLLPP